MESINPRMAGVWIWEEYLDERKGGMRTRGEESVRGRTGTREHALYLDLRRSLSPIELSRLLWTPDQGFGSIRRMWVSIFRDSFLSWMSRAALASATSSTPSEPWGLPEMQTFWSHHSVHPSDLLLWGPFCLLDLVRNTSACLILLLWRLLDISPVFRLSTIFCQSVCHM